MIAPGSLQAVADRSLLLFPCQKVRVEGARIVGAVDLHRLQEPLLAHRCYLRHLLDRGRPAELLFQLSEFYWEKSKYLYRKEMLKFQEDEKRVDEAKNRTPDSTAPPLGSAAP